MTVIHGKAGGRGLTRATTVRYRILLDRRLRHRHRQAIVEDLTIADTGTRAAIHGQVEHDQRAGADAWITGS